MELILLIITLSGAWFWLDSIHTRDKAVEASKVAAERYGLQLLDDTVAFSKLWAARDERGRLHFQRTFNFEVSTTGAERLACHIIMLGVRVDTLYIPPHQDNVVPLFH